MIQKRELYLSLKKALFLTSSMRFPSGKISKKRQKTRFQRGFSPIFGTPIFFLTEFELWKSPQKVHREWGPAHPENPSKNAIFFEKWRFIKTTFSLSFSSRNGYFWQWRFLGFFSLFYQNIWTFWCRFFAKSRKNTKK